MNTIILSIAGVITLVILSLVFNHFGEVRDRKISDRLSALRRKFTLAKNPVLKTQRELVPERFISRDLPEKRFRIFPANGDAPVL